MKEYQKIKITLNHAPLPGLFVKEKVEREKLPGSLYCYDIRNDGTEDLSVYTLEKKVINNRAGSIIVPTRLAIEDRGLMFNDEISISFAKGETMSIEAFERMLNEGI